jgi:DNA-binding transcriptional MocR family regulator
VATKRANSGVVVVSGTIRGPHLSRLLGNWQPQPGRGTPEYAALAGSVRSLLIDGRLPLGVRLPAERELAGALRISRTTVSAAYRLLRESGHLTTRRGAGSWTTLPGGYRLATGGLWAPTEEPDVLNLAAAAPPAPPELTAAAQAAAADLGRYAGGTGYHPFGLSELRDAVAQTYTRRGLPTSAEQIMVTSGVQHAFHLALRLLVPPGAGVLVESPTYPNSLAACTAVGARVTSHGVDPTTGWDEELLLGALRQTRPRIAYLIPDFHNPTGHLMPARLRERLAATARLAAVDLVVDESFVDLALAGAALPPPVAAFDRHARVLTVGGMSKPYWGGLRVGWVRAAGPVVQRLAAVRMGVDVASPVLDQLVAVRLLERADEIIPARRAELLAQRDALVGALRDELPQWRFTVPDGGVSLWAELDAPVASALARTAEELGVRVAAGPRFGVDGTMERFLRLPYTLQPADLVEAVHRLAAARHDLERAGRPQPASLVVA